MTQIICDFSKKAIPNAERGVNYVTVLDKNLSMAASEELEKRTRKEMSKYSVYTFKKYRQTYRDVLMKMCK